MGGGANPDDIKFIVDVLEELLANQESFAMAVPPQAPAAVATGAANGVPL